MMEVVGQPLMVLMTLLLAMTVVAGTRYAINCKFSNEGCESDDECCSRRCLQAHPGTNPRCTRSSLHNFCLYNYQCEDRLICGSSNTCCSKYWGTCSRHEDCCKSDHICIEAEGFYYKRCLMGKVESPSRGSEGVEASIRFWPRLLSVLLTKVVVNCVTSRFYDVL